jgi:hypothetical protein
MTNTNDAKLDAVDDKPILGVDVQGHGSEVAKMRDEPKQLAGACRCGARTRTGRPCRSPAVGGRARCRMHGGAPGSGGPRGEKNGMYRHGRHTHAAKELSKFFREMARDGEALLAKTLNAHGLGRKLPARLRRRAHIKRALAKAKEVNK